MEKHLPIWKFIHSCLDCNVRVILLYVLESTGSSPGRQGFFMAVNEAGEMLGSIGGGIMEHKLTEMAKEKLKQDKPEHSIRKQVHDKTVTKDQSGMICSGEQTIFCYRLQLQEQLHVQRIVECLENNKSGVIQLSPVGLSFLQQNSETGFNYSFTPGKDWLYREKIGYKNQLYIIGAGHCALALSKMMRSMDFYIRLFDDRKNLKTFVLNEFAHEKANITNYSTIHNLVPPGNNIYVVVMTVGYRTDDIVVRTLMGKQFRFFGVLGSKKKIEKMFDTYRAEGISEELLRKIHAPVGLPIFSQTPEEIAISIAAQIIKVKNA